MTRAVTADDLVRELEALHDGGPAVLAFDGDGTLWAGDVGEDLFESALGQRRLLDEAIDPLARVADDHGVTIADAGDPHRTAEALYQAYVDGRFPEEEVCCVMAWCYVGYDAEAMRDLARATLDEREIDARFNGELDPILAWGRRTGLRTLVVSASPRSIVEEAASRLGFEPRDVLAATPAVDARGVIVGEMASPLPYADGKRLAVQRVAGDDTFLAAFGDNDFDLAMLAAATRGVAVRPKPALAARLGELARVVLLKSDEQSEI